VEIEVSQTLVAFSVSGDRARTSVVFVGTAIRMHDDQLPFGKSGALPEVLGYRGQLGGGRSDGARLARGVGDAYALGSASDGNTTIVRYL
jgi:hypothetical protein